MKHDNNIALHLAADRNDRLRSSAVPASPASRPEPPRTDAVPPAGIDDDTLVRVTAFDGASEKSTAWSRPVRVADFEAFLDLLIAEGDALRGDLLQRGRATILRSLVEYELEVV